MRTTTITNIMNGPWRDRAIYTAEERGIPQFADGLKPVQRFLICKALKTAKTKFEKVATIATIATEGYHHGEQSAAAALIGMAADFSNNLPIFEGDGNFGNVLNPSAGAPRYIYARLAPYFDAIFKDMDLCPKHDDPDHVPPKFYLPIIPLVLVNGIKGIATGYATDIPPHDPLAIIDWLIAKTKGKNPSESPKAKYYGFTGTIGVEPEKYLIGGTFERLGANKLRVTELPRGYTCATYNAHLRKLQERGIIASYEDNSRMNQFEFSIILKRGINWTDAQVRKNLKLDTTHGWNLTTVSIEGKIQEWPKIGGIQAIMEAFYEFRLPYIQKRIEKTISVLEQQEKYQIALQKFCGDTISGKFSFKGLTDEEFHNILINEYACPENKADTIMNMPMRSLTKSMMDKLQNTLQDTRAQLMYYRTTTPEKEYQTDLEVLQKAILKYYKEQDDG